MGILDDWIEDMPQQFQGKERIEILISAFAKQLEELHRVFKQLDTETDLESAVGINLDMVGEILNLSRKNANAIIRKAENTIITDDVYRKILKYKSIVNSGDCTYKDLMDAINILWDTDNITYYESPDRPATVLLTMPTICIDIADPTVGKVLTIKPAGIAVIYTIGYWVRFMLSAYERFMLYLIRLHWGVAFVGDMFASIIKHAGIKTKNEGYANVAAIQVRDFSYASSDFTNTLIVQVKVNQVKRILLDGEWLLDGSVLLNPNRWKVPVYVRILVEAHSNNDVSCTLISKKNSWYLDGSFNLDGSRYLNAIEKKEVI